MVSAPSGTGKTTLCHRLVSAAGALAFSVSHTTREPRPGEQDGVDYHFVSKQEFERLVREGAFLEHAEYRGNLYGTSLAAVEGPLAAGQDLLLEIEVQGARQLRSRLPEARMIFLLPPSRAELEHRLRARGTETDEVIARRLAVAAQELPEVVRYDYAVVNDDLEAAVGEALEIVRGEREGRRAELEARFGAERVVATLGGVAKLLGES